MTKEQLNEAVLNSKSITGVLHYLKMNVSSKNHNKIKELIETFNIDTSHFENVFKNRPKKDLNDILIENSIYQSSTLKKRLIKEGLKEDRCEICGCSNEWNGKPLTLQLDHINGDHYDNRLENLRIVCPNCHSQTDTFGKSKPRKKCPDCGTEINSGSTYCKKCAPKHKEFKEIPTENILISKYKELKSYTKVGEYFGVTDNAVRKWFKKYNYPTAAKELKEYLGLQRRQFDSIIGP